MSTHRTIDQDATSSVTANRTIRAAGRPLAWRGVDLLTAAMLAVAFGVAFWAFDTFVYPLVTLVTAGFPPAGELALGVWLIPAVVGGLIVRRPGAALFTELIAANIELILGNGWGVAVLLSGLLQGLGVEAILALFRWRRFGAGAAVLGGVASAALEIIGYEWWAYTPAYTPVWKLVYLACGVASGAAIAGLGGHALARALARTGALNAFPVGQELRESRTAR